MSKVASCQYKGPKINVVDTPGHAEFAERSTRLSMVDGVMLVVDAFEGPMPKRASCSKALDTATRIVSSQDAARAQGRRGVRHGQLPLP